MSSLLTVKQVAEKLNVSVRTVQRMQEDGQIAFVKIGKCVRMREEHLENWIEKRTVKPKKIA
jgi:excisionase family DNA binding protein